MSAFMCTSDTFAALVTACDCLKQPGQYFGYRREVFSLSKEAQLPIVKCACNEAELMRNILAYENIRSLSARYPNDEQRAWLHDDSDDAKALAHECSIRFMPIGEVTEWCTRGQYGKVLHLMACYEYQSCESDDWETTTAYKFCRELEQLILSKLRDSIPDADQPSWGGYKRPDGNPGPISLSSLLKK